MNSSLRFFALAAAAWLSAARAHAALCQAPASRDLAPAAHWQRVHPDPKKVDVGARLLGLDGSRIEVMPQIEPYAQAREQRMVLGPVWASRVDWSVYHRPTEAEGVGPVLYFDKDARGALQLCRYETREFVPTSDVDQGADEASPDETDVEDKPHRTRSSRIEQLHYDSQERLSAIETREWDDEKKRWAAVETVCLTYAPEGWASGRFKTRGDCLTGKREPVGDEIYVHTKDGQLLRSIVTEAHLNLSDPDDPRSLNKRVTIYSADGSAEATYDLGEGDKAHRRPIMKDALHREVRAIWSIRSVADLSKPGGLPMRSQADKARWELHAVPRDTPSFTDHLRGKRPAALAQGTSGPRGEIVNTPAQAQLIWRALQDTRQLVVFTNGYETYLWLPLVKPEVWRACIDARRNTRADCP
jgi:hypothetical protein